MFALPVLLPLVLSAAEPAAPRGEVTLGNVSAPRIESLEITGEIRLRGEYRDPLRYDSAAAMDEDTDFVLLRTRVNLEARINPSLRAFVQFQDSRIFGEEASPTTDEEKVDLHQSYVDFKNPLDTPWTIRAGRQELAFGSERLVSASPWSNVGRAFDGVKASYFAEV